MRIQYLIIAIAVIAAGCNNSGKGQTENNANEPSEEMPSHHQNENGQFTAQGNQAKAGDNWVKLLMYQFRDQQGRVTAEMPFPSNWKMMERAAKGEPAITGPNGIKVINFPLQIFMDVLDPRLRQSYYQSGQQLRAMPGIGQLIEQDMVPWAAQQGLQFVRHYEIPEVTQIDKWYNDQLYQAVPGPMEIAAIGTDWVSADGTPYFLLIHLSVGATAQIQSWSYYCSGLQAEKPYFEAAKKQLLFSIANTHYPLEPIMEYNQREAEKAGQSWAAHNRRMAQNQANFEASQRAHVNRSNAINDAIMSGWRERNAASDKNHEQFVDVITERTNVIDPSTGKKYKVSSGSNQYWMNSNGEYIGTNLNDYNPNLDDNMNNERWQQLKEVK